MKWHCWRLIALVMMMLGLGGCPGGGQVGGREFAVKLHSLPESGAIAYVVPYEDWLRLNEQEALEAYDGKGEDPLRGHKITSGRTPVTVKRPSYSYIFVAELRGERARSEPFTPGEDEAVTVLVE